MMAKMCAKMSMFLLSTPPASCALVWKQVSMLFIVHTNRIVIQIFSVHVIIAFKSNILAYVYVFGWVAGWLAVCVCVCMHACLCVRMLACMLACLHAYFVSNNKLIMFYMNQ